MNNLFDETGHWKTRQSPWSDPGTAFENVEFWATFSKCLGKLSQTTGGRLLSPRIRNHGQRRSL